MAAPLGFVPDGFEPDSGGAPASASYVARPDARQPNYNPEWARSGVNALPAIGGLAGGVGGTILGGPAGGLLGAATGGYAGNALRRFAAPSMDLPMGQNATAENFGQAATQASLQALGGLVGMAGKASAPSLMRVAVRPSVAAEKRVPDLIPTILDRGLRVGGSKAAEKLGPLEATVAGERAAGRSVVLGQRERNVLQLNRNLEGLAATERAAATPVSKKLIQDATAKGRTYSFAQLAERALRRQEELLGPLTDRERLKIMEQVRDAAREMIGQKTYGLRGKRVTFLTPNGLDAIRQHAQDAERAALNAKARQVVRPVSSLESDIATQARDLLHSSIKGLAEARATESAKIRLSQAAMAGNKTRIARLAAAGDETAKGYLETRMEVNRTAREALSRQRTAPASQSEREAVIMRSLANAESRPSPWLTHLGVPGLVGGAEYARTRNPVGALGAAAATRLGMSPWMQSRAALGLNSGAFGAVAPQVPLTVEALLQALMTQPRQEGNP